MELSQNKKQSKKQKQKPTLTQASYSLLHLAQKILLAVAHMASYRKGL